MAHEFKTFEEFWPFYVLEHAHPINRALHFVGTSTALSVAAAAVVLRRPTLLAYAPLAGYGAAWIGHFFVEHNRPATFTYPAWSLRGDFVMWTKIVTGQMDAEIAKAREIFEAKRRAMGGDDDLMSTPANGAGHAEDVTGVPTAAGKVVSYDA